MIIDVKTFGGRFHTVTPLLYIDYIFSGSFYDLTGVVYCVIKPHNITSSNTKAKMAQTTIEIPYFMQGNASQGMEKGIFSCHCTP